MCCIATSHQRFQAAVPAMLQSAFSAKAAAAEQVQLSSAAEQPRQVCFDRHGQALNAFAASAASCSA
jgi:hypothetical protein